MLVPCRETSLDECECRGRHEEKNKWGMMWDLSVRKECSVKSVEGDYFIREGAL